MNPATDTADIARPRATPESCPVCRGAGVLPSMTVAGLTNPCPRCLHALKPTSRPVEPIHGQGFELWPGPILASGGAPPTPRRHDDRTARDVVLALLLGLAIGAAFGALVVGIFVGFGS